MMEAPLLDVLSSRQIIHPTSLREVRFSNGEATLKLEGYPWWLPPTTARNIQTSSATIKFGSITQAKLTDSCLNSDALEEDLEEFGVVELSQALWNQGVSTQIFCSAAINDVPSLFSAIDEFLIRTDCPFARSAFLHQEDNFSAFLELTSSSFYMLSEAPMAVCQLISVELERQNVKHNIVASKVPYVAGLLVEWWDGFIVCDTATISWESASN